MEDWFNGYIVDLNNEEIICILSKEFQLDLRLTSYRNKLSKTQNSMVSEGIVVRYDVVNDKLEFMAENGIDWI